MTEKNATDFVQHIKFTQQPVAAADDTFIDFIRTETGKIRPLAISDLESYLADGKILLNIGKPFQLEGIGSLIKQEMANMSSLRVNRFCNVMKAPRTKLLRPRRKHLRHLPTIRSVKTLPGNY